MPTRQGSFHLFRIFAIDVYLHWSWFLIAAIELSERKGEYHSLLWNLGEYVALFLIVLIHEFGHALACRSVGGFADQIILWPLGGVAYVAPPQRAGATLWTIFAGPLVNIVLAPILWFLPLFLVLIGLGEHSVNQDLFSFIDSISWINLVLLFFNILPIYPLDGGQILRSLLWFPLGRARSLMVASILGIIGIVAFIGLIFFAGSGQIWYLIMGAFLLMQSWSGLKTALALSKVVNAKRRPGYNCPSCHAQPPIGNHWTCPVCKQKFDMFNNPGNCPSCGAQFSTTPCFDCNTVSYLQHWSPSEPPIVDI